MDLFRFWKTEDCLDLLILVQENDTIKRCMHGIESVFKTTKLNRIKHHSLFDPENDKQNIQCKKVLVLIEDKRSAPLVEKWIQELPQIKGNPKKQLVLCLREDEDTDNTADNEMPNAHVYRSRDVMSWFPKVLQFIYGTKAIYWKNSGGKICLIESECESQRYTEFKQQFKTSLQRLTTITEDLNQETTVIYMCNDIGEQIENTIKTKLRKIKLHGNHVYVFACSYRDTSSDDVQWVATRAYTRNEAMLFLLHLMVRLELLDTREEFVRLPHKPISPVSDIKVSDPVLRLKQILIEWKVNHNTDIKGKIIIEHRTDLNKEWDQLVSNLPLETTSYSVSDLDTGRQHQFRLVWVSQDGESNPTNSSWFSWKTFHKGRLALKICLYFLAFATGVFNIPQFLICCLCLHVLSFPGGPCSKNDEDDRYFWNGMCYCGICFMGAVTMFVLYGVFQRDNPYRYYHTFYPEGTYGYSHDGDLIWLLLGGLYLFVWCIVIHFVMKQHGFDVGSLQLPKVIYDKANDIQLEYYLNDFDNPV